MILILIGFGLGWLAAVCAALAYLLLTRRPESASQDAAEAEYQPPIAAPHPLDRFVPVEWVGEYGKERCN